MQGGVVQIIIDDSTNKIVTGRIEYDRGNGGTFIGPYGTTLPVTPEDYEWFLKTDTNELYHYDGAAWQLIAGGSVTAIHVDEADEISGIAEKSIVADADIVVIEDSAASFVKKKVQVYNLPLGDIDGGSASSTYLTSQVVDGGTA